ncbi:hypothetical protein SISNIDRAFT_482230 [Sistotremastrum niveocremeum HHB9708]|uniref:Uncharacterized protein n=1 Tax=Sistotremastrum niveocremeum HHB9708 TaxID=1314777 RepID=A0A164YWU9_9AGAM|nr:hypothetical protein SISNIDRAFT_482230 [Sistotremastrum niveocremeum HHB9708]
MRLKIALSTLTLALFLLEFAAASAVSVTGLEDFTSDLEENLAREENPDEKEGCGGIAKECSAF